VVNKCGIHPEKNIGRKSLDGGDLQLLSNSSNLDVWNGGRNTYYIHKRRNVVIPRRRIVILGVGRRAVDSPTTTHHKGERVMKAQAQLGKEYTIGHETPPDATWALWYHGYVRWYQTESAARGALSRLSWSERATSSIARIHGDVGFADPGGDSALRAASADNPRNMPCPDCGAENVLTPADVALGYHCDACARQCELGY